MEKAYSKIDREETYTTFSSWIRELESSSSSLRQPASHGGHILKLPTGETVSIRRVQNPSDPAIRKMHALVEKTFNYGNGISYEELLEEISDEKNYFLVIEDEQSNVVSLYQGYYLKLNQSESMLYIVYIVTDPSWKKRGLASELYQDAYGLALQTAKENSQGIAGVVGETEETVESFLNRMGRKRIYFEDQEGNFHEVPYQTGLYEFNPKTGEANRGKEVEHFMLRFTDGRTELAVQEFLDLVKRLYEEKYPVSPEKFENKEGYQKAEQAATKILQELSRAISKAKGEKLFLLSVEEREAKQQEGKLFHEIRKIHDKVKNGLES